RGAHATDTERMDGEPGVQRTAEVLPVIVKEEVWRLERLHPLKRHLRIFDNLGVSGIADELNPRVRSLTASECDRIILPTFGNGGYPHGGSLRVPRYPEGAQGHATQ